MLPEAKPGSSLQLQSLLRQERAGMPMCEAGDEEEVKSWQSLTSVSEKNICSLLRPLHSPLWSSCSLKLFVRCSFYEPCSPMPQPFGFSVSPSKEGKKQASGFFLFASDQAFVQAFSLKSMCNFRVLQCLLGNLGEANSPPVGERAQETSHRPWWQLAGQFLL